MPKGHRFHWDKDKLKNHVNSEYFGLCRRSLQNFKCCHNRVRDGKCPSIEWDRNREGYIAFMNEIGEKPNDGMKWSVGRINHDLGYQTGNIRWELHIHNSVKRKGTKYQNCIDAIQTTGG
jgi:hypothetical protein